MTLLYENEDDESFLFDVTKQMEMLINTVCKYFQCPYEAEVSLLIVTEEAIQQMNGKYRGINRSTDVLSFPMIEFDKPADWNSNSFEQSKCISPDTGELLLGDIVICAKKVKEQAIEYNHSELREFSFLIVHSLLHLMGFDHMDKEERAFMEKKQKDIMKICNIQR